MFFVWELRGEQRATSTDRFHTNLLRSYMSASPSGTLDGGRKRIDPVAHPGARMLHALIRF
jgi:hypothetical protein